MTASRQLFKKFIRNYRFLLRTLVILSVFLAPFTPLINVLGKSVQAKSPNVAKELPPIGPYVDDPLLLLRYRMPDGTQPLIRRSIRRYLRLNGLPVNKEGVREFAEIVKVDELARLKIAPLVLSECFRALNTTDRSRAQEIFYKHFQEYFANEQREAAVRTLQAWRQHKRQYAMDNQNVSGLSVLTETGPTLDGFEPPKDPIKVGEKGTIALLRVFSPLLRDVLDDVELPGSLDIEDPIFDKTVRGSLGALGYTASAATVLFLEPISKFGKSVMDDIANGKIRAKEIAEMEEALGKKTGSKAGSKGGQQAATQGGKQGVKTGSKNLAKTLVTKLKFLIKNNPLFKKIALMVSKVMGSAAVSIAVLLIAIPALLDSILALVALVKTIKFEEQLIARTQDRTSRPDLYKMLNENIVKEGTLCYSRCKEGYKGSGFLCLKDCPGGYEEGSGKHVCRKVNVIAKDVYSRGTGKAPIRDRYNRGTGTAPIFDRYNRGRGTAPTRDRYNRGGPTRPTYNRRTRTRTCPSDRDKIGGLCYKKCRSGYRGSGNYCVQKTSTCGSKEKVGGLCYSRCKSGYRGSGSSCVSTSSTCGTKERIAGLCYTGCRSGYTGRGSICTKNEVTCTDGELTAGLCYPKCKEGYFGIGTNCRQKSCPTGYTDQGAVCRLTGSNPDVMAKERYRRGIGKVGECIDADTRDSNRASISLYLMKMLVADPVDGVNKANPIIEIDKDSIPPIEGVFYTPFPHYQKPKRDFLAELFDGRNVSSLYSSLTSFPLAM